MNKLEEQLNKIDHRDLDADRKFYDVRSLYESVDNKLTSEQKRDLEDTIRKNPNLTGGDITNIINGMVQKDDKNNNTMSEEFEDYDDELVLSSDDNMVDCYDDDDYDAWQMGHRGRFNKFKDDDFDEPLPFESLHETAEDTMRNIGAKVGKIGGTLGAEYLNATKGTKIDPEKAGNLMSKVSQTTYGLTGKVMDKAVQHQKNLMNKYKTAVKNNFKRTFGIKDESLQETISAYEFTQHLKNGTINEIPEDELHDYIRTHTVTDDYDPDEDYSEYEEIESKDVRDSNGFWTEYTLYQNIGTGEYVCVFGDKDIYRPDDGDWDAGPFETEEEAYEWFNSYNGFEDDDIDESFEDTLGAAGTVAGGIVGGMADGPLPVGDVLGGKLGNMAGKAVGRVLDKTIGKKQEGLKEDMENWTATDIVRDLYNKYPNIAFVNEYDKPNNRVALIFKLRGDVNGLEDLLDSYNVEYSIRNGKLCIIADEDEEYEECLTESEDNALANEEIERILKRVTNNFTKRSDSVTTSYEEEKNAAKQILKKHYKVVEVSDGRRGPGEEMCWVVAYATPLTGRKNESLKGRKKR